jgi:hypothetical protein
MVVPKGVAFGLGGSLELAHAIAGERDSLGFVDDALPRRPTGEARCLLGGPDS